MASESARLVKGIGYACALVAFGAASIAHAEPAKQKWAPMEFTISNNGCFKGSGIKPYVDKAIAQRIRTAKRRSVGELATFYVQVPYRSWRGLTVTAVGLHYESTSIYCANQWL